MRKIYMLIIVGVLLGTATIATAAVIKTFYSPSVEYQATTQEVEVSKDGVNWSTNNLAGLKPGDPWYARLQLNGSITGHVYINWYIQNWTSQTGWLTDQFYDGGYQPMLGLMVRTEVTLTSTGQTIYATPDGSQANNNFNWGNWVNWQAVGNPGDKLTLISQGNFKQRVVVEITTS